LKSESLCILEMINNQKPVLFLFFVFVLFEYLVFGHFWYCADGVYRVVGVVTGVTYTWCEWYHVLDIKRGQKSGILIFQLRINRFARSIWILHLLFVFGYQYLTVVR